MQCSPACHYLYIFLCQMCFLGGVAIPTYWNKVTIGRKKKCKLGEEGQWIHLHSCRLQYPKGLDTKLSSKTAITFG